MFSVSFSIMRVALRTLRAAAGGGSYSPSLDFSDARNSQYLALI